MQQVDLDNWAEFKSTIEDIRKKHGYHEYTIGDNQSIKHKNTVLFRGQQCAEWSLKTTLERKTDKSYTVSRYLSQSTRLVHELESFTGSKWGIDDFPELEKEIEDKQDKLFGPYLPRKDYLIYLRHHGYPSPLLDWSESPYIAAYFAMSDPVKCEAPEHRSAIYAYIDNIDSGRSFAGGTPMIKLIGPFVSTHKRHFAQKAQYTIAVKWSDKLNSFIFCSHHEVFDNPNKFPNQDLLIKITIPVSDRNSAMRELDDYNINHFTLFQTEDALIKKLSIDHFDIKDY